MQKKEKNDKNDDKNGHVDSLPLTDALEAADNLHYSTLHFDFTKTWTECLNHLA